VIAGAGSLGLEPAPFDAPPAIAIAGAGGSTLRLLPHEHGTDGYFVASLVRRP
jgi:16S rRNA (cytosine967-C5)-methyltransferase